MVLPCFVQNFQTVKQLQLKLWTKCISRDFSLSLSFKSGRFPARGQKRNLKIFVNYHEGFHTNAFLPAIQIRWKLRHAITPMLTIRSQQIFVHATTAQICSDHGISVEVRVKQNFHRIWIAMEKPLVKRGPALGLGHDNHIHIYTGCNYSSMSQLQRRFSDTALDV